MLNRNWIVEEKIEKVGEKAARVWELKARGSQTVNKSSKKIKIYIIIKLTRSIRFYVIFQWRECLENFEKATILKFGNLYRGSEGNKGGFGPLVRIDEKAVGCPLVRLGYCKSRKKKGRTRTTASIGRKQL